jgi:hypothetical protein
MNDKQEIRHDLGDFASVICFKSVITGVEDTLGEDGAAVVFTRAGKMRGASAARSLGIANQPNISLDELVTTLNGVFGSEGTRLCAVLTATRDGDKIVIDTKDTVCSAGEAPGSERKCTFTLGAVGGALEAVMGQMYIGEHTDSVLRGGSVDRFVFSPI